MKGFVLALSISIVSLASCKKDAPDNSLHGEWKATVFGGDTIKAPNSVRLSAKATSNTNGTATLTIIDKGATETENTTYRLKEDGKFATFTQTDGNTNKLSTSEWVIERTSDRNLKMTSLKGNISIWEKAE